MPEFIGIVAWAIAAEGEGLAVRHPFRRQQHGIIFSEADLPGAGAIGLHDPQIIGAGGIADKGDLFAVGREDRLGVERQAGTQGFGRAATGIHRIDITQHIEDHRLAIGRDGQRHPGTFGRVEADFARRIQRQNLAFGLAGPDIIDGAGAILDPADRIAHRNGKIVFMGVNAGGGEQRQQGDKRQVFHFW